MKKIILTVVCLTFLITTPVLAAELKHRPISKTDQTQTVGGQVETKGLTQVPNRVTTRDKVSSTGHKHDQEGSEDLRPNPLDKNAANAVNTGRLNTAGKPVQK